MFKNDRYTYRNEIIKGLINILVDVFVYTTLRNIENFYARKKRLQFFDEEIVRFSDAIDPLQSQLNAFIYKEIIFKGRGDDINHHNKNIIRTLFRCYAENPSRL